MAVVEVHLYGSLRHHAPDPRPDRESVVRLEPQTGDTVGTTLERIGISPAKVYHLFLNGTLLYTRNSMARWLDYQQAGTSPRSRSQGLAQGLDTPVQPGDRLGLFARDMGLLVV
jgi:hypothetical protein